MKYLLLCLLVLILLFIHNASAASSKPSRGRAAVRKSSRGGNPYLQAKSNSKSSPPSKNSFKRSGAGPRKSSLPKRSSTGGEVARAKKSSPPMKSSGASSGSSSGSGGSSSGTVSNTCLANKDGKVLIVGAGPAGMHFAMLLKEQGYTNVEIWERTDRVGGKSYTIYLDKDGKRCDYKNDRNKECVAHEMGTCFLHNGYHIVRKLADKYGLPKEVAPEGRSISSGHYFFGHPMSRRKHIPVEQLKQSFEMADLISAAVKADAKESGNDNDLSDVDVALKVLRAMGKYNQLHEKYFGLIRPYSFPLNRLSDDKLRDLAMPASEFLKNNDLKPLLGFLNIGQAAQGYGYLGEISAFYLLWWMTPELLHGFAQQAVLTGKTTISKVARGIGKVCESCGKWFSRIITSGFVGQHANSIDKTTTMLPTGYQSLWEEMQLREKFNIKHNRRVTRIERNLRNRAGKVKVHYHRTESQSRKGPLVKQQKKGEPYMNTKKDKKARKAKAQIERELKPNTLRGKYPKNRSGKRAIKGKKNPEGVSDGSEEFDCIIYTGPLKTAFGVHNSIFTDVTNEEKNIFSKLKGSQLTTTIYKTDKKAPGYTTDDYKKSIKYNVDSMQDSSDDWRWYADRWDLLATKPHLWSSDLKFQIRVGLQLGPEPKTELDFVPPFKRNDDAHKKLFEDVKALTGDGPSQRRPTTPDGYADIRVPENNQHGQFHWPYFFRFVDNDVAKGYLWDIVEMQGKNKVFYMGASSSFESVNDVTSYNCQMMEKLFGKSVHDRLCPHAPENDVCLRTKVSSAVRGATEGVKDVASKSGSAIKGFVEGIASSAAGAVSGAFNACKSFVFGSDDVCVVKNEGKDMVQVGKECSQIKRL